MKILGRSSVPDIVPDVEAREAARRAPEIPYPPAGRGPEDDFFCLRFGVWYPSFDCAIRTRFRTCPGCLGCEQGRFNLKRHATRLARERRIHRPT